MFGRILLTTFLATVLAWAVFARASDGAGRAQFYVVEPGDSLWSIAAERYPGDPREGVWKLQRGNGLSGATISPGQRLVLP
jgi:hypothetical protein